MSPERGCLRTKLKSDRYQTVTSLLRRLILPKELRHIKFQKELSWKIANFLKENDQKMIFVYGQNDPWTAAGVTWLKGKKNVSVFIQSGESLPARIAILPEGMREQAISQIQNWLDE